MKPDGLKALLNGSIRSRLIFSFSVVALLAVISALIAMFLLQTSERQTRQMLTKTLPIVSDAQALGQSILVFATASRDLPNVVDPDQLQQLMATLGQGINDIDRRLKALDKLGIDQELLHEMLVLVDLIRVNLRTQHQKAEMFLDARRQQESIDKKLDVLYHRFTELIKPQLVGGYRAFINYSQEYHSQISKLFNQTGSDEDRRMRADSLYIGLYSLVDAVVGELWAEHELTTVTHRVFSLIQGVQIASSEEAINKLQQALRDIEPALERLKLILKPESGLENQALEASSDLYALGTEKTPLFHLRLTEINARTEVVRLAEEADILVRSFGEQARMLTEQLRKQAAIDSGKLQDMLRMAGFIQLMLIIVLVLVSVAIGWYYVDRRLISRIITLKVAMDEHAMGRDTEIPLEGADEITDMAQALRCFVHQRVTVETALRQSLDSLNEAQSIAKFGSCSWDEKKARWQWSDGFYRMLGFEPGEIDPEHQWFLNQIDQDDRQRVAQFFERLTPSSKIFEVDFAMRRKDESYCMVSTRWKYSKVRGKITGTLSGTVFDITERQRIEEELLKVKKLESIGVLAGGIAHDFNNLLTVIMGNASLARRELPEDHVVQQYLRLSENATSRARELTERLLTFAKGGDPVRSVTDLRAILVEVVEFVLHGSNVKCIFNIPDTIWPANVDAGQMAQVLQNLVGNARQAMPDGGLLDISCFNASIAEDGPVQLMPGNYIGIVIADQGHGIAEQHLKRIFDPYFTTREMDSTKGSGLGLAIVHSIIRKHGGTIEVASTVGKGTTFTVYVPARPDGVQPAIDQPNEIQRRSGLVLVMDDEHMIREIARSMLEHLGFQVLLANDGKEAIAIFRDCLAEGNRPDAVIMDLTIPGGMGGEKAAREILDLDATARLIVSSGYSNDQIIERYWEYGFCAIARKPYRLTELSEAVDKALTVRTEPFSG